MEPIAVTEQTRVEILTRYLVGKEPMVKVWESYRHIFKSSATFQHKISSWMEVKPLLNKVLKVGQYNISQYIERKKDINWMEKDENEPFVEAHFNDLSKSEQNIYIKLAIDNNKPFDYVSKMGNPPGDFSNGTDVLL